MLWEGSGCTAVVPVLAQPLLSLCSDTPRPQLPRLNSPSLGLGCAGANAGNSAASVVFQPALSLLFMANHTTCHG